MNLKTNKKFPLLIVIIFIYSIVLFEPVSPIIAQTNKLKLTTISWQGAVQPGANNIGLNIEFINLNDITIKGILGNLSVIYPFTDAFDNDQNVIASGIATSTYINVSEYNVFPGEPFQLIFSLNIDSNAIKGIYSSLLNVTYYLNNLTMHFQEFSLNLVIPNRPPVIDWFRPTTDSLNIEPNETILFEAGGYDFDMDPISFSWKLDGLLVSSTNNFIFKANESTPTTHRVILTLTDGLETTTQEWFIIVEEQRITEYIINNQYLEAGSASNLEINLKNNLWNGTIVCSFSVPQPIIIKGNSSYTYRNIKPGDMIVFKVVLYTPSSTIGQTTTGSLTITYNDKFSTQIIENYGVGLISKGRLVIKLLESEISSNTVKQGDSIVISGTLLNTGNIPALFANISVIGSILEYSFSTESYIGEIEPDSPLPFSITVKILNTAQLGASTIQAIIYYQNDLFEEFSINVNFNLEITEQLTSRTDTNSVSGLISDILGSGFTLLIIIGTFIAITVVLFRYYRKK